MNIEKNSGDICCENVWLIVEREATWFVLALLEICFNAVLHVYVRIVRVTSNK